MTDNTVGTSLLNAIKQIVDNYLINKGLTSIVLGVYKGSDVEITSNFKIPISMLSGNLKSKLKAGDKLRLIRNEGHTEYYILEIIGKDIAFNEDMKDLEKRIGN